MNYNLLAGIFCLCTLTIAVGCGGDDKAEEGQTCVIDADCQSHLNCLGGICLELGSRELYEACQADGQCESGTCAQGYCTTDCAQFFPTGTYAVGDCITENVPWCVSDGVGCCQITEIQDHPSTNQQEVSGFCTANP